MPARFKLTLYVTPDNADGALSLVHRWLKHLRSDEYELQTVDLSEQPDRAAEHKISKTPALVVIDAQRPKVHVFQSFNDDYPIRYVLGLARLW